MSGPWAEGGRMPELTDAERALIAQHEKRIGKREVEERDEDEVLQRLRDGIEDL